MQLSDYGLSSSKYCILLASLVVLKCTVSFRADHRNGSSLFGRE